MNNSISPDNILNEVKPKVYIQDYSKKTQIEGVKIVSLKSYPGEEGDFGEILRLNDNGSLEDFPEFKLAQINKTLIFPNMVKAWHIHYNQDEIWYVLPSGHLITAVWDLRKDSPTKNVVSRIVMGGGNPQLLYIPKGVAHGYANVSENNVTLLYFVNQKFNIEKPDEYRIPWDSQGIDFWKPERD